MSSFLDKFKKGTKKTDDIKSAPVKIEKKVEANKGETTLVPKMVEKKPASAARHGGRTTAGEVEVRAEKKKAKDDTGNAYRIIIKPIITEKASIGGAVNKYMFFVAPRANKVEVRYAIKDLYGVDAVKINIANVSGKMVKRGRNSGQTKDRRKAIVTLKPGQSIQVYEGV